jgi:nitrate/nitrite transporter NarK
MTKDDLRALPAAIGSFNGFYTRSGRFILMNSMRILIAFAVLAGVALIALVLLLVLYLRRRSRVRRLRTAGQG